MKRRMRLLPILCLSAVSVYSALPFHAFAQGPLVQETRLSEMFMPAISPAAPQVASGPAAVAQSSSLPQKAGVYLYQEGNYGEVEREVLTLRKPWWLGSSQMNDVVTKRRNVRLNHPRSRLQLSPGAELLLVLPEGASPAEYRLLRLDGKRDRREFRVQFRWRELKQTQSDVTGTITPSFWPLGFWPPFHNVLQGRTDNITLNLSDPAPTSGLTLNLSMDNTAVATVPSSVFVGSRASLRRSAGNRAGRRQHHVAGQRDRHRGDCDDHHGAGSESRRRRRDGGYRSRPTLLYERSLHERRYFPRIGRDG